MFLLICQKLYAIGPILFLFLHQYFLAVGFDIIRDSRRWLIIAGQENKAFAAHQEAVVFNQIEISVLG